MLTATYVSVLHLLLHRLSLAHAAEGFAFDLVGPPALLLIIEEQRLEACQLALSLLDLCVWSSEVRHLGMSTGL